jgi:parvulin-like peptidyl-prolyl isomerase
MRHTIRLLLVVAVLGLVAACGGGGPRSVPGNAVAVVGSSAVEKSAFDKLVAQEKRLYHASHRPFPAAGTPQYTAVRNQLIQYLIGNEEFDQKAKELHVKITDKQVDERLTRDKKRVFVAKQGGKPLTDAQIEKRYRHEIAKQGVTDAQVRENIKRQLLSEAVFAKVTESAKVSDSDIKDYYNKHKKDYRQPAQPRTRDVRHILVASKALAQRLVRQLRANPSLFPKFVNQYSTDKQSKIYGGRLPTGAGPGLTVAPFTNAAFALKTHEISDPVRSQFGWHIIQALGPIKAGHKAQAMPLSQVKETIRQLLVQQKKNDVLKKWVEKTRKDFCSKIGYAPGYKPPANQDPCKRSSKTTSSSVPTTG